eukprot:CFRG7302T1
MWSKKVPVFDSGRLKVDLKLCAQRLQQAQRKRSNQNLVARREIATLLAAGKESSARVKAEFVVKDDEIVEAMEMIELFCNLLSARFGLLASMQYCDDSILKEICSIIWVAPRMSEDIRELDTLMKNLIAKYGEEFGKAALENKDSCVNDKLYKKMDLRPPSKKLINAYLEAIAETHNVAWEAPLDSPPAPLLLDNEEDLSYHVPVTEAPTLMTSAHANPILPEHNACSPRIFNQINTQNHIQRSQYPPNTAGNQPSSIQHIPVRNEEYTKNSTISISGSGFDILRQSLSEHNEEGNGAVDTPYPIPFPTSIEPMSVYPPRVSQGAEAPPSYHLASAPPVQEDETSDPEFDDLAARFKNLKKK